jgi:hypothetical protein
MHCTKVNQAGTVTNGGDKPHPARKISRNCPHILKMRNKSCCSCYYRCSAPRVVCFGLQKCCDWLATVGGLFCRQGVGQEWHQTCGNIMVALCLHKQKNKRSNWEPLAAAGASDAGSRAAWCKCCGVYVTAVCEHGCGKSAISWSLHLVVAATTFGHSCYEEHFRTWSLVSLLGNTLGMISAGCSQETNSCNSVKLECSE